jgi:hypothetical protein
MSDNRVNHLNLPFLWTRGKVILEVRVTEVEMTKKVGNHSA